MTPSFEFVRLRTDARVAWIEFNRAPVNAFNRNMVKEVRAASPQQLPIQMFELWCSQVRSMAISVPEQIFMYLKA